MLKRARKVGLIACVASIIMATNAMAQHVDWRSWPVRTYVPRNYDVLNYRIQMRFDHPEKQFFGRTTVTLLPLVENPKDLTFDAEVFTVREVTLEDRAPLRFAQRAGSVTVSLDGTFSRTDTLKLTFSYDGRQIEIDPVRWGVSKDYHVGIEFLDSTAEHPALISTLSFPEGARHWFPCNDHPSDKATQETVLEVPSDWKAVSNGALVSVTKTPATATFHWDQRLPHSTYLAVIAAGPYVVLSDSLGPLPLNYWVYPQHVPDALRSFSKTAEIIAFFERTYGVKYPWSKYDQVLIPGIGGGAESTTATVLGQNTIHDARADQDFPSHWLVAHEAAHQWWGDLVTFKDWGHTWINESFATYSEYLYSRWSLGEDEGALNLNDKREQYYREASATYRRPIVMDRWKFPNDNFDAHTYPKGANVLHMLRVQIGDEAFFAFLKKVLADHAFGNATTDEIRTAAEAVSGRDLSGFFDQWLMKPGHPVLNVSWRWDAQQKKVLLRVEQTQDTTGGIPIYTLAVDIGVWEESGHTLERVTVRRQLEEFILSARTDPILVEFDEAHDLLAEVAFPRPPEQLIVQLEKGNALSRMFAANELARFSDDSSVVFRLMKAATSDPFWGVRRAAVTALGSNASDAMASFLKTRLDDRSSKVRAAAVRALGVLNEETLNLFFKEQFTRDDSYVVQAEIVRAIGRMKMPENRTFLERAAGMRSPRDIVKRAAMEGIDLLEGR